VESSAESEEKEPVDFDQLVEDTLTKEVEDFHADPTQALGPRLRLDADGVLQT
jgi:hypothetical protein